MTLLRWVPALLLLLLGGTPPPPDPYTGLYTAPGGVLELHRGPEGALRGYRRTEARVEALAPVEIRESALRATATHDDGTRTELTGTVKPGPVLELDGREYRRSAVERPADAAVRREIEAAYRKLGKAVAGKDFAAFQAIRTVEFATIPPDGTPRGGASMADRARGLLERIQPPIENTNDILELTVRGDDAIATVRQKFTRRQLVEGTLHEIHTEVTQRETWTRTPEGFKLLFVDEVRDPLTLDNGERK